MTGQILLDPLIPLPMIYALAGLALLGLALAIWRRLAGWVLRTLAALVPRPLTIGIALFAARLPTIFPQPHDIPLDLILTEDGIAATRPDSRTHR